MTDIISEDRRRFITKSMVVIGSLCSNHRGSRISAKECPFKYSHPCPAEISLQIQNLLESTLPESLTSRIIDLKNQRTNYAEILTKEEGIIISEPEQVIEWLFHHTGAYEDIVLAASLIKEEFGKDVELEIVIQKDLLVSFEVAMLLVRLPSYDGYDGGTFMDKLDEISTILCLDDDDHRGWVILTSDFRFAGGNKS